MELIQHSLGWRREEGGGRKGGREEGGGAGEDSTYQRTHHQKEREFVNVQVLTIDEVCVSACTCGLGSPVVVVAAPGILWIGQLT